jgi:predicted nucleic acid-binding protein
MGAQAGVALGRAELVAPPLLWSEVPSVLRELSFRGEISGELAQRAFERFLSGEINVSERRPDGLVVEAWKIAAELGWAKTYDAEYLALARLLGCRLVTLDVRLRRRSEHLGFVVAPAELAEASPETENQGS